MAITRRQVTGKIEVLEDGQLQLRLDTVLEEDGQEIHRGFHRVVYVPGQTLPPTLDSRVLAVAGVLWTPAVIQAYQEAEARRRQRSPATPQTRRIP